MLVRDRNGPVVVVQHVRRPGALALPSVLGLLVALAVSLVAALPAAADDLGSPGDPFGGQSVPPGPVYVITPGGPTTGLPPTSDPDDVEEQIEQDIAKSSTASPGATPSATGTTSPGATPGAPGPTTSAGPDGSSGAQTSRSAAARTSADEDGPGSLVLAIAVLLVLVLAGGAARWVQLRRKPQP